MPSLSTAQVAYCDPFLTEATVTQTLPLQATGHTTPHAPQLFASVVGLMHVAPQGMALALSHGTELSNSGGVSSSAPSGAPSRGLGMSVVVTSGAGSVRPPSLATGNDLLRDTIAVGSPQVCACSSQYALTVQWAGSVCVHPAVAFPQLTGRNTGMAVVAWVTNEKRARAPKRDRRLARIACHLCGDGQRDR